LFRGELVVEDPDAGAYSPEFGKKARNSKEVESRTPKKTLGKLTSSTKKNKLRTANTTKRDARRGQSRFSSRNNKGGTRRRGKASLRGQRQKEKTPQKLPKRGATFEWSSSEEREKIKRTCTSRRKGEEFKKTGSPF